MKKIAGLFVLSFVFSQVLFSETFEIVVNKDTNFVDNMGEDMGKVSQGTVLTVNSENDQICHYFEDREGKDVTLYLSELDKFVYMRDITVKNASDSLPKDIIGFVYTMGYYLKDILNDSTDNLFLNEPYLKNFWNEKYADEDENFSDYYKPFSIKFYSNIYLEDYDSCILYSRTPFFIENIKKENAGFYLKLILLTPRNGYSPIFEGINEPRKKSFYLKFQIDGDYLLVYKDGTLIFELIKANENMLSEIRSFYVNHEVDFSRITFPRHADGNMKTGASDNQSMEESESVECAKSTEFLPNPLETKDERKVNRAAKMNKKEENDDFVFPFIQVGFGIILIIVLLPIILVIAKKRKAGKK
ncbi:MAG: hypothetical protein HDR37_02485 [Treponema sp.]|nr:hypothetical protein [Treponema sp.]